MAGMFVPQMVASTGSDPLSGLANLTNRIGQWREDAQLADIMKGFDPANPYSYEDTLHRLATSGIPGGRDMQDRILGIAESRRKAQETAQQGEYQQGQLGVHRGQLSIQQQDLALRQQEAKRLEANRAGIEQGLKDIGATGGPALGDRPPGMVTPPVAPRAVPIEEIPLDRYAPRAPATATPGPGAALTSPTPVIRAPQQQAAVPTEASTTPVRTAALGGGPVSDAGPSLATPDPRGTPEEQAANAQRVVRGERPVPPASTAAYAAVPSVATPVPPVAAAPVKVAQAAPAAPPVTLPPAGIVTAPEEAVTQQELDLRRQITGLNALLAKASDPGQREAIKAIRDSKKADLDAITSPRTEAQKEATKAEMDVRKTTNIEEAKSRNKMAMEYAEKATDLAEAGNSLDIMENLVTDPRWRGGILGYPAMWAGLALTQLSKGVKEATGKDIDSLMGKDFSKNWIEDPTSRLVQVRALAATITRKTLGSLAAGTSNADRDYVATETAGPMNTTEDAVRLIRQQREQIRRHQEKTKIVLGAAKDGLSATEINQLLVRYAEERPSFINKDGTLTPLGRELSPQKAREENARLQARDERAAKAGEEFRDTSGTGEGAVMGYRPSEAEKRAVREREGREPPPARPIRPLGESIGSAVEAANSAVAGFLGREQDRAPTVTSPAPAPPPAPVYTRAGAGLSPFPNYAGPGAPLPPAQDSRGYRGPGAPFPPAPLGPPTPTLPPGVTPPPAPLTPFPGYSTAPGVTPPAQAFEDMPPLPPPRLTGPVPPRGYRGPGAPLPAALQAATPAAPAPLPGDIAQPAAAVVGAPPLTAGERFDQWVRGRVNPAEAIPRPEPPVPRPVPTEAAVVPTAAGRRRGEALDAARRARGITPDPQRYFDDPTEASVAQNRDYMRKISEQALRRDPRGLRPELFREFTRVEYQPQPYGRLLSGFSNVDQEAAAERNLLTLPPRGRLSDQAGLVTLETIMRSRGIPENVTSQIIQRGDEQRLRDLVNKPLPKPRDNSAAESKATVERENRRRDRRTAP